MVAYFKLLMGKLLNVARFAYNYCMLYTLERTHASHDNV